ncbi:hypothetical protein KY284_032666 [Solanum tuberosum]|nr:hypothetical protein KY284_032666 [Solanum tuberosum]
MGYKGRGVRFGLVPHGRRPYGNQPHGGEQREAYSNKEYSQEVREDHGNHYQGEIQRGYYNNDQGGHGCRDVGINSIKTRLLPFKGECNADDYIEWESLCERLFQVNDLTEVFYNMVGIHEEVSLIHSRRSSSTMDQIESPYESQVCAGELEYTENEDHANNHFKVGLNKEISSKMAIHKFASSNDIFDATNEVERELKKEKVPKYKGKDFKKPYEKKYFEGNTPRYPPREGGNNDPTKFPKGIQCHKCRGWGHMMCECANQLNVLVQEGELYLGEGEDQEEGCEEDTQEEDEFEGDEDEEQDPCEGKYIAIPNGLMRKAPIEEA